MKTKAVTALWNQDELFRKFVETSDDLLTVVDTQGRFLYVSPSAWRVWGLRPAECVGRTAWEFIHTEDREHTSKAFESWLAAPDSRSFTFENRQVGVGGEVRHMHWTVTRIDDVDGRPSCLVSCARDVTANKHIERELQRAEVQQRSVLEGLLDPLLMIDFEGRIHIANKSCETVFGYEADELVGQNVRILLPEPYRSEHDTYLARYRATGETGILGRTREFEIVRKDGTRIICELSVSRIEVPGRDEPFFCGSFRDVTARKRAEQALAQSERRFRAIFDREFEFVGLLEPDGTMLEANHTVLQAAGLERRELIGRPFWETAWWVDSARAREELKDAVRRAGKGEFVRFEIQHRNHSGELCTIDFSLKPVSDEEGRVVMLIPEGRDITEIKRAQQREITMMRAFAEIGESASLLAHEIKNPITSVNLALRAVSRQLGQDEKEVLEDLVERMQKLERLMRRTLSLARPIDVHPIECSPAELLESTARTMRSQADEAGIELSVVCGEGLPDVSIDPHLMEEALTNLVRNGLEALQGSGRILLGAEAEYAQVILRIEDDGPGVPEKVRETLFKPFVSTKSSGTGLGLAIVRKIVEAHGGTIESGDGALGGACFEIRLPTFG